MLERRKHPRYLMVFGSSISPVEIGRGYGVTQDVSSGGSRMLTASPIGVGKDVQLRIFIDSDNRADCVGQIMREKSVENRGIWKFEIGISFEEMLPDPIISYMRNIANGKQL
jgi:hypothetical protein